MKYIILSLSTVFLMIVSSCSGRSNSGPEPRFYSTETPGKWQAQAATHIPQIEQTRKGDKLHIRVSVSMTATPSHYIEAILLTDKNHKELAKKSLGKAQPPEATLDVPGDYREKLYVVIKCNLHDMWQVAVKPK
jgi:desulfoferrodoxin (superoxide reductase-like protein)